VLAAVALWGVLRPAEVVERTEVVERVAPVAPTKEAPVAMGSVVEHGDAVSGPRNAIVFENLPEESYLRMRNEYLVHGALPTKRPAGDVDEKPVNGEKREVEFGVPAWQFGRMPGGRS
jgi:hypothetical protein